MFIKQFFIILSMILLIFSNLFANYKYKDGFTHFSYVNPYAKQGGNINLFALGEVSTFNPYGLIGSLPENYYTLYFDTLLFSPDDDVSSYYPLIAEKFYIENNKIIYHINKNAYWHDNTPIASLDVYFTIKHLVSFYKQALSSISNIHIIDDYTISVELSNKQDIQKVFGIISTVPILQYNYWHNKDFTKPTLDVPISSGAYFISYNSNNKIVFSKNKNYWAKNLPTRVGYFNFDTITYTYSKNNNIKYMLFNKNQVDLIPSVPISIFNSYPKHKQLSIKHDRIAPFYFFAFNLKKQLWQNIDNRKSIANAYNFEKMNSLIHYNFYIRSTSLFENSVYKNHFSPYNFELNLDKQFDDVLNIIFLSQDSLNNNIDFINNLNNLGFKVNAKVYTGRALFNAIASNTWDILEWSLLFNNPPSEELQDYFFSNGSLNYWGLDDDNVNNLINNLDIKALDVYIMQNYYFIPLYYSKYDIFLYNNTFDSPIITPMGLNIFTWSIK